MIHIAVFVFKFLINLHHIQIDTIVFTICEYMMYSLTTKKVLTCGHTRNVQLVEKEKEKMFIQIKNI